MNGDQPAANRDELPFVSSTGGLIRREFLRRSGATGALLATGGLGTLLSACGGDDSGGTVEEVDAFPAPETVDTSGVIYADYYPDLADGGALTIGHAGQLPTSLDVFVEQNGANIWAADPVHDRLEHFEPNGKLAPSLAESFELVDDRTFRYTLHEGATFHNGRPVTSEDVKKTFEWVQDPANNSYIATRIVGVTVDPIDDRTVELKLDAPNAALRSNLSYVPIVPIEEIDTIASEPVGCGPYIFDKFVKDNYVSYRRNPDYWNPDAPRADTLRINFYAEIQTGARAFLSGQNDFVTQVSLTQLGEFQNREESGELRVSNTQGGWLYVAFNHKKKPYDDPRVRQAISLAVDRNAIVTSALGNGGLPLFFPCIVPNHPWYPADLEFERDVDEAKSLLAEAGMPDGFSDTLLTLDKDYFQAMNTVIQSNLREIGIDLDLEVVDIATLIDRTFTTRDFTITTLGDLMSPEPSTLLEAYFASDGGSNYFGYASKRADELLLRARDVYDPDERKERYREAFEVMFLEDVVVATVTTEPVLGLYVPETNGEDYRPEPNTAWHYPIAAKQS